MKTSQSVKLLRITIDDCLKFNEHISLLRSKAMKQLNAVNRLQKYGSRKIMK